MDHSNLRILFWNACGLRGKIAPLKNLLQEQNIDIALISETLLGPGDGLKVANYHSYRQDEHTGQRCYRGLAVLVRRRIIHQPLPRLHTRTLQALGIEILVAGNPIKIFSIYKPPVEKLSATDVLEIFSSDLPTIAAGDWNSKHTAWNSSTITLAGRQLFNIAEQHNLSVSGPDTPTRYPQQDNQNPDVLDIVVHKGVPQQLLLDVIPEDMGSDHLPVLATLRDIPTRVAHPPPRQIINWNKFQTLMEELHELI